ncbi:hypothetical protein Hte_009244 [Hypoxylon texense]
MNSADEIRLVPRAEGPLEKLAEFCQILRVLREKTLFILTGPSNLKDKDGDNEDDEYDGNDDDDASEASSYCQSDSFSEIAEDLTTETNNLMDLHPIYESALESKSLSEGEAAADIAETARNPQVRLYTEQIEMRFPGINPELAIYLGEVNYERFLRCSENRQLAEATTGEHEFHDSDIGTSAHFTTSARSKYAETVMSFHHGNGFRSGVPPIPKDGRNGRPFLCVACGKRVSIRNNKAWKRHLLSDLRPYICFEPSCYCLFRTFESRADWVYHIAGHKQGYDKTWPSFRCHLCFEDTGEGEANVTIHLERHLQDISLAILPNIPEEDLDSIKADSPAPATDDDPDDPDEIKIAMKRASNALAARKARERKAERLKNRSENGNPPGCNWCMRMRVKCDNPHGCTTCERLGIVCVVDSPIDTEK